MFELLMVLTLAAIVLSQLLPDDDDNEMPASQRPQQKGPHSWRSAKVHTTTTAVFTNSSYS